MEMRIFGRTGLELSVLGWLWCGWRFDGARRSARSGANDRAGNQRCCKRSPANHGNYPTLRTLTFTGALAFIIDVGRKRTEANMIAGPAWMLDCCSFVAATSAARGGS